MDVNKALAKSAEAAACLREAGWALEADVMDSLAAEVERLRMDCSEAIDALQSLYDWQNGCPLSTAKWLNGWGVAMDKAKAALKKHEAAKLRRQEEPMDVNEAIRVIRTRRETNLKLQWHELAHAADVVVVEVERLREDVARLSKLYGEAAFGLAVFRGLAEEMRVRVDEAFGRFEEEMAARAAKPEPPKQSAETLERQRKQLTAKVKRLLNGIQNIDNAYEYRRVEHPTRVLGRIGKALEAAKAAGGE